MAGLGLLTRELEIRANGPEKPQRSKALGIVGWAHHARAYLIAGRGRRAPAPIQNDSGLSQGPADPSVLG